jgi:hypothetical protein
VTLLIAQRIAFIADPNRSPNLVIVKRPMLVRLAAYEGPSDRLTPIIVQTANGSTAARPGLPLAVRAASGRNRPQPETAGQDTPGRNEGSSTLMTDLPYTHVMRSRLGAIYRNGAVMRSDARAPAAAVLPTERWVQSLPSPAGVGYLHRNLNRTALIVESSADVFSHGGAHALGLRDVFLANKAGT